MTRLPVYKISVIIPVYNCECHVADALNSILSQTISDFEVLVIDDCSTDRTVSIIENITDKRITLIKKEKNTGYTDSLNTGIKVAQGEFIARMDGDDISHPNRFELQLKYFDVHPDVIACGTAVEFIPGCEIRRYPLGNDEIRIGLLDYSPLVHPSVMIRRQYFLDEGLFYDKSFEPSEDYHLWIQISSKGKLGNLPEVLLKYRLHENQVSRTRSKTQKENADRCRISMLCSVLEKPSSHDIDYAETVYQVSPVEHKKKMLETYAWLDNLVRLNLTRNSFQNEMFRSFVLQKKRHLAQGYFMRRLEYSPKILNEFFSMNEEVRRHFDFKEVSKMMVKCMIFYKVKR